MCESCPYTTTKSSNMVRHKQVRHKNAPKEHACDKCPALFSTLSGLKDHITSVHSSVSFESLNRNNIFQKITDIIIYRIGLIRVTFVTKHSNFKVN